MVDPHPDDFFTLDYCAVLFGLAEAVMSKPTSPRQDDLRDQMLPAYTNWINGHVARYGAHHLTVWPGSFSLLEH